MFEEQIKAGVAWLDETVPDWRAKIDTSTLRLSSTRDCVLGQVFGSDEDGAEPGFYAVMKDGTKSYDWAADRGFAAHWPTIRAYREANGEAAYARLREWDVLLNEWLTELSDGKKAA